MAKKTLTSTPQLEKAVCQVNYDRGYRYLDRCGQTLLDIMELDSAWTVAEANPQSGGLVHLRHNLHLQFDSDNMSLTLSGELSTLETMLECIDSTFKVIIRNLGLRDFLRIGFRTWNLFPVISEEEGDRKVQALKLFEISESITERIKHPLKTQSFSLLFESKDGRDGTRLAMATLRREAGRLPAAVLGKNPRLLPRGQKEAFLERLKEESAYRKDPRYAILLDVDEYRMEPSFDELQVFLEDSVQKRSQLVTLIGA